MDNIYNFFFYITAKVSQKINSKDKDFAFTAVVFVSLCMISNILALLFLFMNNDIKNLWSKMFAILITLPLVGLNWFFLMRNGKSENIISYYNEKYADIAYNKISLVLISLYIIFSFSSVFYLAYLLRNHLL